MTQDVTQSSGAEAGVLVREGNYGTQVIAVEPGGAEFIPLNERHGRPIQLFWTWTSPNMEFATIFVGVLAVALFGLSFWAAALALALGSLIGGITQGILSLRGPKYGVPQMVLSRLGFGYWGNALPAGLNSVTAGIGWFAVNSVSGAFALNVLTHLPQVLCLLIIVAVQVVVAFFGYNLVHVFERYAFPILTVIFLIAAGVILSKAQPGAHHQTIPGAFLLTLGASFGYAVGWNPYASDYTRYFKPETSKAAIAWWSGLGLFLSCAPVAANAEDAVDPFRNQISERLVTSMTLDVFGRAVRQVRATSLGQDAREIRQTYDAGGVRTVEFDVACHQSSFTPELLTTSAQRLTSADTAMIFLK